MYVSSVPRSTFSEFRSVRETERPYQGLTMRKKSCLDRRRSTRQRKNASGFEGTRQCKDDVKLPCLPPSSESAGGGLEGVDVAVTADPLKSVLKKGCCTQINKSQTLMSTPPARPTNSRRLTKKMRIVQSCLWCTFCGHNLEENNDVKGNLKCHLASKHAVAICQEMGVDEASEDLTKGVDPKAFKTHLDLIDNVLSALKKYNYSVIPACRFFDNENMSNCNTHDIKPLESIKSFHFEAVSNFNSNDIKPQECMKSFHLEAVNAFKKYRVIYLKGIKIPLMYNDLLPAPVTTYKDVVWKHDSRPRSNSFAVRGEMTPEEVEGLDVNIQTEFQNIVASYLSVTTHAAQE